MLSFVQSTKMLVAWRPGRQHFVAVDKMLPGDNLLPCPATIFWRHYDASVDKTLHSKMGSACSLCQVPVELWPVIWSTLNTEAYDIDLQSSLRTLLGEDRQNHGVTRQTHTADVLWLVHRWGSHDS